MGWSRCGASRFPVILAVLVSSLFAQRPTDLTTEEAAKLEQRLKHARGAERLPLLIELGRRSRSNARRTLELTASALAQLEQTPSFRMEAEVRGQRSFALQATGAYKEALVEAKRARRLAEGCEDEGLLARSSYRLAVVEWRSGDPTSALAHAEEARTIHARIEDQEHVARDLTLLGAIHRTHHRIERALECHLQALRISEQRGDQHAMARSHNNIGLIRWQLDRHEEAYKSLQQAFVLQRTVGARRSLAAISGNIGLILIELGRAAEAIRWLNEALPLHRKQRDQAGEARTLSNLGFANAQLGKADAALAFHQQALAIRERIGAQRGTVRSLGQVAEIMQVRNDHATALRLLERAACIADEIEARREQAAVAELLADSYAAIGDTKRALAEYRYHQELTSELQGVETQQRIAEIEGRHEAERRKREMRELEEVAALRQRALDRQRSTQRWLLLGSSILGLCLISLAVMYRLRAKALRSVRDKHERLQDAQRQLAESEQRYRMLFESAVVPTVLIETDTRMAVDLNPQARELCGELPGGGTPVEELQPPWVGVALSRMFVDGTGEDAALDDCWIEADGRLRWTEIRGSSVVVDGRACRLVSVRDTTDVREHELAALRAEKLESLGLLAGGIAHDFNNALTSIIGYITLARTGSPDESVELLELAELAASRAGGLTGQLLAFAKGGEPVCRSHDIGQLLGEAVQLAGAGSSMRVDLEVASDLLPVEVDSGQFAQLVSNLVLNAQQASPEGSTLSIRASNHDGVPPSAPPGECDRFVRIEFSDNGPGIAKDVLDRIFDPYFTTKSMGSGLGLSTAYAIANRHGGALTVESCEGQGATFRVFLPASCAPAVRTAGETAGEFCGVGSVLVLEDEPMVQSVYGLLLEKWGYEVELVADGAEAVRRFAARQDAGRSFDLLIMDLTIVGGMGGRQAMAKILERDPAARAVVCSGYSEDPTMARYKEAGFAAALAKPFRAKDLARVIAAVMGVDDFAERRREG